MSVIVVAQMGYCNLINDVDSLREKRVIYYQVDYFHIKIYSYTADNDEIDNCTMYEM